VRVEGLRQNSFLGELPPVGIPNPRRGRLCHFMGAWEKNPFKVALYGCLPGDAGTATIADGLRKNTAQ